jgi:hypothetical protein
MKLTTRLWNLVEFAPTRSLTRRKQKQNRRNFLAVLLFVGGFTFLTTGASNATSIGMSADPMGSAWDRLDPGTGYATWDTFASTMFSGELPGSTSGIASPGLSQGSAFSVFNQGAGLYNSVPIPGTTPSVPNDGDILFPGGNTVSFTISGSVSFQIGGLALEIKRAGSTGGLADASGFTPMLSINGGAPIPAAGFDVQSGTGDTTSAAGTWSVTTWYWGAALASIPDAGTNTFALTFSKTGSQRTLDGMSIDIGQTALVPEPSSGLLAVFGLSPLAMLWRRRKSSGTCAQTAQPPSA